MAPIYCPLLRQLFFVILALAFIFDSQLRCRTRALVWRNTSQPNFRLSYCRFVGASLGKELVKKYPNVVCYKSAPDGAMVFYPSTYSENKKI